MQLDGEARKTLQKSVLDLLETAEGGLTAAVEALKALEVGVDTQVTLESAAEDVWMVRRQLVHQFVTDVADDAKEEKP